MNQTDYNSWEAAQEADFKWYAQRMYKEQINTWNSAYNFFREYLDQTGKIVAEIGCGPTGGLLKFMKAQLLIGVEPLADRFLKKGFENISNSTILFLNTMGENIPLVDNYIDIVCCLHSLGHSQYPERILHEADRILKENGQMFIMEIIRKPNQITPDHPVAMSEKTLGLWFEKNDYQSVRTDCITTIEENNENMPLFNGVYRKKKRPVKINAVIDFDQGDFENQLCGGWYDLEKQKKWFRWVSDVFSAYLSISAIHKAFFIEGYVATENFTGGKFSISFSLNGAEIGKHSQEETGFFHLNMPVPPQFKSGKVQIVGKANAFFVPNHVSGNGDCREISVQIFRLGFC